MGEMKDMHFIEENTLHGILNQVKALSSRNTLASSRLLG